MPPLHDYQEAGVDHLLRNPRAGLFMDMGLGKTATVLSALTPEHLPVLVIAPKRVAQYVWGPETRKWRPDLRVRVAVGSEKERLQQLEYFKRGDAHIMVITRDNIADLSAVWPRGRRPFRTVVLDELSSWKNRRTQRFKITRKLTRRVPYVWGLTGTPSPNGLMDLWSQLYLLDGGQRLGKTIGGYRTRYFVEGGRTAAGVVTHWVPRPEAERAIHRLIDDICLSMKSEGRIHLPPVTFNDVVVPLEGRERQLYKTLKRDSVLDLSALGGTKHLAETAAALSNKLQQVTAGFIYTDDKSGKYELLHKNKIAAVQEIVEGTGSPVLVLYKYQAELDLLLEAMPYASTLKDRNVLDDWNRGKVPVLIAHPASVGHGLNLQHGGYTAVWSTVTWSLEEWDQANKRLLRQGQEHPVIIHTVTSPNTVDDAVRKALQQKTSVQQALLDHLESPL